MRINKINPAMLKSRILGENPCNVEKIFRRIISERGGRDMWQALVERMKMGFTFLKMDLGIELIREIPGTMIAPLGYLDYLLRRLPAALEFDERVEW